MDHFMTESLAMHQHCVQLIYAACKCAGRSSLRLSAEVNVSLMKWLVTVRFCMRYTSPARDVRIGIEIVSYIN
jgi:hypothetical protein